MTDVHALSGAYALDALDDDERATFEQHLAECHECRREVDSLRAAAAELAELAEVTPPPGLRDRVLAATQDVRPLPPDRRPSRPASRRLTPSLLLAAASVVLLAMGIGLFVGTQTSQDDAPPAAELTATERVLQADDAKRVPETFQDGAKATVVVSEAEGSAVIVTEDMPPPPEGKVYEAWFQVPGEGMVPAGLMPTDEGDGAVLLHGDPSEATAIGLTVEPEGGSDEPTTAPFAVLDLTEA